MRTVGLFGGSFDPPHVAHLLAARHALEDHELDELWFVPVYAHPGGKTLTRYADRAAMCDLAIEALGPCVDVSRAEEELGPCVTLAVLRHLAARHADTRWRLVMGTDLLRTASSWSGWRELVACAPPIGIARGTRTPAISSTQIRTALASQDLAAAAALLPPRVLDYAVSHGLYAT